MNPQQSGDATSLSLLQRVRNRDQQGFHRLMNLYGPLVDGWLRSTGLQDADCHNVSQEVFQKVWRKIDTFRRDRPTDSFRGWLRTITKRKLIDYHRAQKKSPQAVGGSDVQQQVQQIAESWADSSDPAQEANEVHTVRQCALDLVRGEFEERTWQAFWRVTVNEESVADVACDLGISPSAVRLYRSRVLSRLRDELRDLEHF
jgi:RNA polymerase sigma-70 factor (ECF subfamily)